MRTTRLACAAVLILTACALFAQNNKKGGRKAKSNPRSEDANFETRVAGNLPAATFAGVIPAKAASDPGKQSDWPAIARTTDGALWIAYVEWNDKDADRVLVRRRAASGEWSAPRELADGSGDHHAPAIVAIGERVLVAWPAQVEGNFELFAAEVGEGNATRPERLTRAPHSDFNVRAASDGKGNVTLVWQSFRNGNADVYARRRTGQRWGREVLISASARSDWEPAVALDGRGTAWISWDSYDHGNYDVMLRSLDAAGKPGAIVPVTSEPAAQFHSSVAVDGQDRVWVAWDDGGENWGKDYSTSSGAPGSGGLHWKREMRVRAWANGRLYEPASQPEVKFTGRMKQFAELPHLAVDGSGGLVLVFRHWTGTKPNEIYHFYGMRLTDGAWSDPWQFGQSSGHNSQHASLAPDAGGGFLVAYASDGRSETVTPTSQAHALHYVAYVADWADGKQSAGSGLKEITLPAPQQAPARRPRHTMRANGRTYTLLLGDSHRHTDIRGHSGVDGSVLDTYRYAIDAAQLDFLGTSDHNEVNGGKWPDGLRDYQWYGVQKAVDLFTHAPTFIGVYSYEHSMSRPGGHRNVLFLKRGAPLRMIDRGKDADNQPPAMWKFWEENVLTQPGQRSVIVPHTFGAGPLADFNWPNARFDCLLEIYQGARGSYEYWRAPKGDRRGGTQTDEEGHFARDALAKGNTYGFVSFSDHASTHNSWAAVWSKTLDRAGVLEGMYERRTYAATDEMIVRMTAGVHMPGEEWSQPVASPIRIQGTVDAPDQLRRLEVVKDGKIVYTTTLDGRRATLDYRDRDVKTGRSYYYVRVFQRDTEKPEGDPEIAWASPFYVTYR
ncbi:MAG: hypothetical protein R2762_28620 [Bryobacteraceae bacterium]